MGYFNNPRTEEELDNQCRILLKKYNYRSGQSNATVEKILQEYKTLKMQIKRANGYKTPSEQVVSTVKDVANYAREERQREQSRVDTLRSHKYTQIELQQLVTECKKYIDVMLKGTVQENSTGYNLLQDSILKHDPEYVLRWFNKNTGLFTRDRDLMKRYDTAREKLEYAFKSMASNKRTQETYIIQMEKSLGNYVVTKFKEYEEMYGDPIQIAKKEQKLLKANRWERRSHKGIGATLGFIVGVVIFVIGCGAGVIGAVIGAIIGILFTIWFSNWYADKMMSLNKKRLDGIGKRKQLSRMSEKEDFNKDKMEADIVKIISRL